MIKSKHNGIFFKNCKDEPVIKVQLRYIRHYMFIFHMASLLYNSMVQHNKSFKPIILTHREHHFYYKVSKMPY